MIDAPGTVNHRHAVRRLPGRPAAAGGAPEIATRPPLPAVALAISAGIDVAALAVAVLGGDQALSMLAAVALHAAAATAAVLLAGDRLTGSRRTLVAALVVTLPVIGVVLAMLGLDAEPQDELAVPPPPSSDEPELPDARHVRRVAAALPACEILMVASLGERRATLAALARRGDASDVSLLRWMVSTGSEMAVEAALALDELGTIFESELVQWRAELAEAPSRGAALSCAALITRALETGIVEPTMVKALAVEARECLAQLSTLASEHPQKDVDADADDGSAAARARLEMAAMKPDAALAILDQALAYASPNNPSGAALQELLALRGEARLLAHADTERDDRRFVQSGSVGGAAMPTRPSLPPFEKNKE
jgi:hypothetical protein